MSTTTWTLRDIFRLAHPVGVDNAVSRFILKGDILEDAPEIIQGFGRMQQARTVEEVLSTLNEYKNLPWETIPTQFLKDAKIWKSLFYNGQLKGQALLRNVVRLSRINAFDDMLFAADYAEKLQNAEQIKAGRVHPISYLNALVTYEEGQVDRDFRSYWNASRTKNWTTNGVIKDAIDAGFYASFGAIEPTGKRFLIGQDVSGSMDSIASGIDLSCAQAGAAFGMAIARTERAHRIMGFSNEFRDLGITAKTDLSSAMRKVQNMSFGSTDCALPMTWALENKIEVDSFVVITDNETWAGHVKPYQALRNYRDKMGIDAKLVVVGMTSTEFSIADPRDGGMLDVCGFDASAPSVITNFSR